jgi:hypothetical protein
MPPIRSRRRIRISAPKATICENQWKGYREWNSLLLHGDCTRILFPRNRAPIRDRERRMDRLPLAPFISL